MKKHRHPDPAQQCRATNKARKAKGLAKAKAEWLVFIESLKNQKRELIYSNALKKKYVRPHHDRRY